MELKRTKTYTIKVDDNNNNKCSKDCEYMANDFDICIFETCTENGIHNSKVEDNNRTEYCKKFFENKELEK